MRKFDYNQVTCLEPKIIRNKYTGKLMSVPCGKCSSCLAKKAHLWSVRCQEESTCHIYTLFGTLTYHNDFLTFKNPYELEDVFYTDSFKKALDSSKNYIISCNNEIPCLNVRDIQLFFKRLRYHISYNLGTHVKIRYFACGEYGSKSFRPHWHYLLWFDSYELAKVIKEYIFESWKSFTNFTSKKEFLSRNKTRIVHGFCERYVAGYVNKSADLPAIFDQKPFRQFHVQSSNPPIGALRFLRESLQGLFSGNFDKIVMHQRSTGEQVILPLWRGLENRLFPKCIGFAELDTYGRVKLYGLYSECRAEFENEAKEKFDISFTDFKQWFLSERQKNGYAFRLFTSLLSKDVEDKDYFKSSLQRLFNISKRVVEVCNQFQCEIGIYVKAIVRYYERKDYDCLVVQMKFEEKMSRINRNDVDLRYYPFIVDSLFYNNRRDLVNYQEYLKQFGLVQSDPIFFIPQFSVPYLQKKRNADFYVYECTKKRVHKEFVSSHPEYSRDYKSLLRPLSLTS